MQTTGMGAGHSEEWSRLCAALVDLSVERGYEQVSEGDVVARAGLRRADFDRYFADRQDCCLQAFAAINEGLAAHIRGVEEDHREESWRDRTRAIAYAILRYFQAHVREFQFGVLELPKAGPLALTRQAEALGLFVDLIDPGREELDEPDSLTRATAEVVVGSVFDSFAKRLPEIDPDEIEGLVPELMYIAVLPYCGTEAAQEELTIPPPPPPQDPR